jgi:alkylation response protein AidB-like acyl-CoA dehydrogenase
LDTSRTLWLELSGLLRNTASRHSLGHESRSPEGYRLWIWDFSPEDLAFQKEVRAFLDDKLNARLREGAAGTPSVFTEPDITREWQAILAEKGWLATSWPVEDGGPGWTPTQKYIFEKECAIAGVPSLPILGLRLVGPVICHFGTPEQKARFLPRIISGEDYWCQGYSGARRRLRPCRREDPRRTRR